MAGQKKGSYNPKRKKQGKQNGEENSRSPSPSSKEKSSTRQSRSWFCTKSVIFVLVGVLITMAAVIHENKEFQVQIDTFLRQHFDGETLDSIYLNVNKYADIVITKGKETVQTIKSLVKEFVYKDEYSKEQKKKEEDEQNKRAKEEQDRKAKLKAQEERQKEEQKRKIEEQERQKREAQRKIEEENKKREEQERIEKEKKRKEEEAKQKAEEERRKIEEERKKKEEEERKRMEERKKAEEERKRKEEEAKQKAEEERKRKEEMRKAEEERKRKEEEAKQKAEEERKRKEELRKAEEERKKQIEEERKKEEEGKKAEEERKRKEEEAKQKAEEERKKNEKRKAEEDRKRKEEEDKQKAEEEKKRKEELKKAEEERKKQKEEEERKKEEERRKVEEERKRKEEEAKLRAEEEKKRNEKRKAEEERKKKEVEAKQKDEEERKRKDEIKKAEEEKKRKAEEEKQKEQDAKQKAEEERKRKAEEKRKIEEENKRIENEAKQKAEEVRRKAEEERKRKEEEAKQKREEEMKKAEEGRKRKEEEEAKQKAEEERKLKEEVKKEKLYSKDSVTNTYDFPLRTLLDKADTLLEKDEVSAALDQYNSILSKHPSSPRALYGKAMVLDKQAEQQQSNTILEQSIAAMQKVLDGKDVPNDLLVMAGKKLAQRQTFRGWSGKAIKTWKFLTEKFPTRLDLKNQLGVSYLMIGRNDEAKEIFSQVLSADSSNGFAKVHKGFIIKTHDNDALKAIPFLREGLDSGEEGTHDGRFYFHLGDAYQRTNQTNLAHKVYEVGAQKGLFLSKFQRSLYNVDSLTGRPWWTVEQTGYQKYLKILEDNWQLIRDEGMKQLDPKTGSFVPEEENLREKGDWKQFTLYARGKKMEKNCARVPKVCDLIDKIPDAKGCTRGQVKYSVMHPGVHVWPHCGPTNCRIRAHLGLKVPPGPKIRVAEETRQWKEGKIIIFDDSFEHEVWHEGKELRMVLIVDFWHPELNQRQKQTLSPI